MSKVAITAGMSLRSVFNWYNPAYGRRFGGHFAADHLCFAGYPLRQKHTRGLIAKGWRWDDVEASEHSFGDAVDMFNNRDFYKCHDILEALWNEADEPQRTLLHALLQSSVGLYHLLNQNHRGAMVELGEGASKLGKLKLRKGPFLEFDKEVRAVLDFLYNTQLENAACNDDFCIKMDGFQENYQLLGNFGAGEDLYCLEEDDGCHGHKLVFCPPRFGVDSGNELCSSVKLPKLLASQLDLNSFSKFDN